MSVEDLYEFVSGEFQTVTRILQYPAGTALGYIRDTNRVKLLGYDIEIWDAETDGVQLVLDTDYTLGYIDAGISDIEGFMVWAGYQVLTPAYQGVNLYITAKIVGGYTTRPYRPTYTTINTDYTTAPSSVDDSIFADAESNPIAVTLADGTYVNQRFAIACTGLNDVTVSGTGLEATAYNSIAVQFIWNGTGWLQLGGAGGGDASAGNLSIGMMAWFPGSGQIPYDKLEANGDLVNILDYQGLYAKYGTLYGGDGITTFGLPDMQGITPGHVGTQDVNGNTKGDATAIGGVREDQMQGHEHGSSIFQNGAVIALSSTGGAVHTQGKSGIPVTDEVNGDPRTGEYTRSTELVGRWLIQAFDTVQEVPADPGLVKDYNLVWEETPAISVPNAWGGGLFFIAYSYDYLGSEVLSNAFMGVAIDGSDREIVIDVDQAGGDSEVRGKYVFSTNSFDVIESGSDFTNPAIRAIFKWGDVATGELNPPVDGWESIFKDDTATSLSQPLTTGQGYYKVMLRNTSASDRYTFLLNIDDITAPLIYSQSGWYNGDIRLRYNSATGNFESTATGYPIVSIEKFNSLVNVVHSYTPAESATLTAGDGLTGGGDMANDISVAVGEGDGISVSVDAIAVDATVVRTTREVIAGNGLTGGGDLSSNKTLNVVGGNGLIANADDIEVGEGDGITVGVSSVAVDSTVVRDTIQITAGTGMTGGGTLAASRTLDVVGGDGITANADDIAVDSSVVRTTLQVTGGAGLSGGGDLSTDRSLSVGAGDGISVGATTVALSGSFTGTFTGDEIHDNSGRVYSPGNPPTGTAAAGQYDVEDTTAGDIAATEPPAPINGYVWAVYNSGTGGNYITGLPGGISLGDGKTFKATYMDGGWRYEDVIIDEYRDDTPATGYLTVTKWAGGKMVVDMYKGIAGSVNYVYPEPFVGDKPFITLSGDNCNAYFQADDNTQVGISTINVSGGIVSQEAGGKATGRWKAGA